MSVVAVPLPVSCFSITGSAGALRSVSACDAVTAFSVISRTSSKPRRTTRTLSSTMRAPLLAELMIELRADRCEQRLLVELRLLHHWRSREECALERDALHAELQFRIGGFFPRDLERVHVEERGSGCR